MTAPDEHPADPMGEALDLLAAAVGEVDTQVGRLPDDEPAGQLVALLSRLRHQRQALAAVEAAVEARVARTLGTGEHDVAGMQVRVRSGSKTTWLDPRTLAWRIAEPLVLDRDSGETHLDPDRVADLLDRLFDCVAVAYFRTGPMRDLKVDYDDLVKREPGRRTVQFLTPDTT
jgi:hypothetical protein